MIVTVIVSQEWNKEALCYSTLWSTLAIDWLTLIDLMIDWLLQSSLAKSETKKRDATALNDLDSNPCSKHRRLDPDDDPDFDESGARASSTTSRYQHLLNYWLIALSSVEL